MPPDEQETDWIYAAYAAEAWHCALTAENPEHRIFNMCAERRRIGDVTAHLHYTLTLLQSVLLLGHSSTSLFMASRTLGCLSLAARSSPLPTRGSTQLGM